MTGIEIEKIVKSGDFSKILKLVDKGIVRECDLPMGKTNVKKITKMGWLSFKNALRLHFDSILLFGSKSYPSAYFLSVLAQEEMGKVHILEDFVFHTSSDGRMPEVYEHALIGKAYMHNSKQGEFLRNCYGMDIFKKSDARLMQDVYDGKLEIIKQNSVYVGLDRSGRKINLKGKIKSPFNTNALKAKTQITLMNDYFLELILRSRYESGYYGYNEKIDSLLNKKLFLKLEKLWENKNKQARLRIEELRKLTKYSSGQPVGNSS